jgi:hypothetical protein
MLFVDHHQPQPRHRRECSQPRADHHLCAAAGGGQPAPGALRRRQPAVQNHDMGAVEVAAQRSLELRREVYLRYQHQHLPTLRQCALHGARIDRGLAAAGDPEQQVYAESAQALAQRIDRRLLPRIEQEGRAGSSIGIASAFRAVLARDGFLQSRGRVGGGYPAGLAEPAQQGCHARVATLRRMQVGHRDHG